jgi:ACS family tartrate transporter-like MFS transporter
MDDFSSTFRTTLLRLTTFLTGRAAAGGLAVIVSIGNLGGFAGPYLVGYVREATHSYVNALLVIAAVLLTGALSLAALGDPAKRG